MDNQNTTDLTKLRNVLYARKSTEDENRQVRSIGDQIADCKKLADELGLRVVATVKETKSAKKPGKRDLFTKLLKDIENKKYDAILCWHPDRLCRNMLEGGHIINMLDEGTLKDIRFWSHQFSNDANGKMLLGMLFVFSKQYSDDLSAKVNRSVRSGFVEGKTVGIPKFGYIRNEQSGLYEPNEHFELVKKSWQKRANGESLEAVTQYLIENGFKRMTKPKKRTPTRAILPSVNSVSGMFKDSFYYGMLVQKSQVIGLRIVPGLVFEPMIDEDTYNLVQALARGRTKDTALKKRAAFYPLRRFVYCAVCNDTNYMYVGKNKRVMTVHIN
jgi:site-specific DNA recombinase